MQQYVFVSLLLCSILRLRRVSRPLDFRAQESIMHEDIILCQPHLDTHLHTALLSPAWKKCNSSCNIERSLFFFLLAQHRAATHHAQSTLLRQKILQQRGITYIIHVSSQKYSRTMYVSQYSTPRWMVSNGTLLKEVSDPVLLNIGLFGHESVWSH